MELTNIEKLNKVLNGELTVQEATDTRKNETALFVTEQDNETGYFYPPGRNYLITDNSDGIKMTYDQWLKESAGYGVAAVLHEPIWVD